jgi:hypothetical protein
MQKTGTAGLPDRINRTAGAAGSRAFSLSAFTTSCRSPRPASHNTVTAISNTLVTWRTSRRFMAPSGICWIGFDIWQSCGRSTALWKSSAQSVAPGNPLTTFLLAGRVTESRKAEGTASVGSADASHSASPVCDEPRQSEGERRGIGQDPRVRNAFLCRPQPHSIPCQVKVEMSPFFRAGEKCMLNCVCR